MHIRGGKRGLQPEDAVCGGGARRSLWRAMIRALFAAARVARAMQNPGNPASALTNRHNIILSLGELPEEDLQ
jgi:hypothetical protein